MAAWMAAKFEPLPDSRMARPRFSLIRPHMYWTRPSPDRIDPSS